MIRNVDNPMIGFWTDMDARPAFSPGGTIDIVRGSPHTIEVQWNSIGYHNGVIPPTIDVNTFKIVFDQSNGYVSLDGLTGIVNNTSTGSAGDDQILGICLGNLGATDPGTTAFSPGGSATAAGLDALYDFHDGVAGPGRVPSLLSGINTITFVPTVSGFNYTWFGN